LHLFKQINGRRTLRDAAYAGVITFVALFGLFIVHRVLTFRFLAYIALPPSPSGKSVAEAFTVGFMSDWWVASAGGLIIAILSACCLFTFPSGHRVLRAIPTAFIGIWGLLLGIHQAYVEFFRHQIIPFHLSYLTDRSFLAANSASGFSLRTAVTYAIAGIFAWWAWRQSTPTQGTSPATGARAYAFAFAAMMIISGVGLHALNIRNRVQWFIPEQLQMNLVEKFFATVSRTRPAAPLTGADLRILLADPTQADAPMTRATLERIVMQGRTNGITPVESAVAKAIHDAVKAKQPVLALTVLMESFRPSNIGVYAGIPAGSSITPHFDRLAQSGYLFRKAYATGGVTRTGQEAVWCGYLGGQETSTMRGREDVRISCLPRAIHAKYPAHAQTAWIHGGDGGFDGQRNYWQRQSVSHITTRDSFAADVARTGWGVGDRTVFQYAATYLNAEVAPEAAFPLTFSMLLSVTNHIPWTLPADAPVDGDFRQTANLVAGRHPAFTTTAYTDFALGELVDSLKKSGRWDHTVLIIASDHGTMEESFAPPPNAKGARGDSSPEVHAAEKLSHIALLVTGGLIEKQGGRSEISTVVSQAGIATFWANILSLDMKLMAPSIFAPQTYPIFADLGHALYLPQSQRILPKESVSMPEIPEEYSTEDRQAILYYRAFIHLINAWGLKTQD